MFNNLTDRLSQATRNIIGRGRLTEYNIKDTLREVRIALLEADVALPVVHEFISQVKINAIGQDVNKSLTPGQEFIKIVRNALITAMGEENNELRLNVQPPAVILMVGLQGAGKTTSVGKLGKWLHEKHTKKVLVVSADVYRAAAIKQLEIIAQQANINFYQSNINESPIKIIKNALNEAELNFYDVLLVDTAGCLHIDSKMILEIQKIQTELNPIETLFVVDAMTGQDAVNSAKVFSEQLNFTGIILTKVDGDVRGGAALSIRHVTGKPIKFIGVGEKNDALEAFHPKRIASRILGMGDMLSLIENIENKVNRRQVENLAKKIKNGSNFDLNDFLEQLKQMNNMGGITNLITKLPSIDRLSNNIKLKMDDKVLVGMEAIINSMTHKERKKPEIIKGSRKRRIAMGSGMQVQDVNRLLKQFDVMQRILKKMINSGDINKIFSNIKGISKLTKN
ncbi:signal recognition particle protein [Pantoea sp. Aalb]|uniref:signal recognition particle protein n=1 Tax=Pantoea sp. Aalb TaxID=2576762 RepID=UPI0013257164|nr:signal recognition particle protein [Pantoea sp. Aalb]MXP67773.1 signal recognition particle protein [Pantoea sp. Aalb]